MGMRFVQSGFDSSGQRDVILFQKNGVIESEPVVRSAAGLHRVFLQGPQTWRGFSGIPNPRLRSPQLSLEAPRQRGASAKMPQKIQRSPLAAEDRAADPLDFQNLGAGIH